MALWTITSPKKTRPQEEVESQEVKEKRGWLRITLAITLLALVTYSILQVLGVLSPTPANAPTEAGAAPPVVEAVVPPVVEPEPVPVVETTTTEAMTTTAPPETTTTTMEPVVYLDGEPGSCLILEEKHCFSGEGFLADNGDELVGFRLPKGAPLFSPWEESTFNLVSGASSSDGPMFPAVILMNDQSNFSFGLTGFMPGDELEGLEEDQQTLGLGEVEGDTLNLGMEIGNVLGEPLVGFGDGTYTLVVSVSDLQTWAIGIEYYEELFGVTEFSN